jgi:hypothetical protein
MASPSTVTRLGGHGGTGGEVRILTRNVSSTAARACSAQVRVPAPDQLRGQRVALGQAEAAESGAGHGDPQPTHRPGPAGGSAAGGFRGLPAASALVIACRIHQVAYVANRYSLV